ncbi:MAG: hypothetical protein BMS9Abin36_0787 [Gammaproteobacteria bacterium]|nr:MAG: hypothetical protein BMS9Abin36_0787 [Gammaproteobacteria bacterium]
MRILKDILLQESQGSFRQRLSVAFVLGMLIVTMVSAMVTARVVSEGERVRIIESGKKITENLSKQVVSALHHYRKNNSNQDLIRATESTMGFPNVSYVAIYNREGKALLEKGSKRESIGAAVSITSGGAGLIEEGNNDWIFMYPVSVNDRNEQEDDHLYSSGIEQKIIGYVLVYLNKASLADIQKKVFKNSILSALVVSVVIIVLLQSLINKLITPLLNVRDAMQQASNGESYIKDNPKGTKEICDITTAFHHLMAVIDEREDALKMQNDQLSGRIEVQLQTEKALRTTTAELEQYAAELERSNYELDQFAYVASHDLKTPLRAISYLSNWIEEESGDKLTVESIEKMELLRGRVRRMEALINGLLQYARAGKTKKGIIEIDIEVLVRNAIAKIDDVERVILEIPENIPVINTYREPLSQILYQLIDNSIQHHDNKREIKISIRVKERVNSYEITVNDNGPGIEERYYQKVFTIFQTLQARDKKEGNGVGMALVKKVLDIYGGAINIQQAEEGGTSVVITWPKIVKTKSKSQVLSFLQDIENESNS